MKPDPRFTNLPKTFWANVRSISQHMKYVVNVKTKNDPNAGKVRVFTVDEMVSTMKALNLKSTHLIEDGKPTKLATRLHDYFQFRADVLNNEVKPLLMDAHQAKALFEELTEKYSPKCPIPMNKQKGEKKATAYLSAMVNILIEASAGGMPCNYNPQELTTITANGTPLRTLSRRVDGAFPSVVNPVAAWEFKEYYYTTTFGSRVADGVYESQLDGMELEELRVATNVDVKHYLFLDARFTWWEKGRPYLCRIVDMVQMGYVDEVIVGKAVVTRVPALVEEWKALVKNRIPDPGAGSTGSAEAEAAL